MRRLESRVAVVTGAAGGLGAGVALRLAEEGAKVVCLDLQDSIETMHQLKGIGGDARSVTVDITNTAAIEAAFVDVVREFGRLDVLCNVAGMPQEAQDLLSTSDELIDRLFVVNARAPMAVARVAAKTMIKQGYGRIINTSSQAGKTAFPGWAAYGASKAAVISFTQSLAAELAPYGITVNAVCPGSMDTRMTRQAFLEAASGSLTAANRMIEEKVASIPLGRLGQPADMGAIFAWLASDDAAFTTGAALNLTGGEQVFF